MSRAGTEEGRKTNFLSAVLCLVYMSWQCVYTVTSSKEEEEEVFRVFAGLEEETAAVCCRRRQAVGKGEWEKKRGPHGAGPSFQSEPPLLQPMGLLRHLGAAEIKKENLLHFIRPSANGSSAPPTSSCGGVSGLKANPSRSVPSWLSSVAQVFVPHAFWQNLVVVTRNIYQFCICLRKFGCYCFFVGGDHNIDCFLLFSDWVCVCSVFSEMTASV